MKHTQGPLTVAPHSNPTIGTNWREIHAANGIYVGEALEANACLISAAPELLAALQSILNGSVKISDKRNDMLSEHDPKVIAARLAIAKATV